MTVRATITDDYEAGIEIYRAAPSIIDGSFGRSYYDVPDDIWARWEAAEAEFYAARQALLDAVDYGVEAISPDLLRSGDWVHHDGAWLIVSRVTRQGRNAGTVVLRGPGPDETTRARFETPTVKARRR